MKVSEFELIRSIHDDLMSTHSGMIQGIGDDCAVVKKDDKTVFLISTDSLIEDVHFSMRYFSFIDLGKKVLSVNLSDIAAMGGTPLYAFVSLGIPPKVSEGNITDLYQGLEQIAREYSVAIAGGDISKSPNYLFINVTVVGEAKKNKYKLRSTAKVGDGIYVSGDVGSAAVGHAYFQKWRRVENNYVQAFKNPRPRLYLAEILGSFTKVHAMIDLSDGLVQDLTHVLRSSKVAAKIDCGKIPREKDFEQACTSLRINPVETLLTGGEDYQLLFTMDDSNLEALNKKLTIKKNIRVTRIGEVVEWKPKKHSANINFPELFIFDEKGKEIILVKGGFDHFR